MLNRSIDIASLVWFRVTFGLILWIGTVVDLFSGHIQEAYIDPQFHFTYYGFEWVKPLPELGMYLVHVGMVFAAMGIVLGLFFRASVGIFLLGFVYKFLIEQSYYLNHHYLVILLLGILFFLPANRAFSLDVRRNPGWGRDRVPGLSLWILLALFSLVYFYAGLAKLNSDWLQGEPLRIWLSTKEDYFLLGGVVKQEWFVYFMAYGGLLFDLGVAPMMLWKRTRKYFIYVVLSFHVINFILFNIGIFPWFMLCATLLYFDPAWPRRLALKGIAFVYGRWGNRSGLDLRLTKWKQGLQSERLGNPPMKVPKWLIAVAGVFMFIQVLIPLRHFVIPGNVHWTEEGHRFSWHMLLRTKRGFQHFVITDGKSGKSRRDYPSRYLSRRQVRKMAGNPDMILQFSHFLRDEYRQKGWNQPEIRAMGKVSLNQHPQQPMIDPEVDLARETRTLGHAPWILEMESVDFISK